MSESTAGVTHAAENNSVRKQVSPGGEHSSVTSENAGPAHPVLPEDIGKRAALMLVEEIVKVKKERGGGRISYFSEIILSSKGWMYRQRVPGYPTPLYGPWTARCLQVEAWPVVALHVSTCHLFFL